MYRSIAALATALAVFGTAHAHHGFGTFDLTADIELTGTVTGLDFVNPHSWLYLDVEGESGVEAYRCEMRAATVLRRSGWSPDMFAVGDKITISGSPDKKDPRSCYLSTVTFSDGSSIDRYGQRTAPTRAPVPVEHPLRLANGDLNLSGDWAPEQFVMTDPRGQSGTLVPLSTAGFYAAGEVPEGREAMRGTRQLGDQSQTSEDSAPSPGPWSTSSVELTALGRQAAEDFDMWSTENPRMRCETTSIVFDWDFDGPVNRITQNENSIVLEYGQYGFTRTIHMDMTEHPDEIEPSRAGHSIGRWENDVLIVDTIGFEPGVLSAPVMHGSRLHVVEEFSLDTQTMSLRRNYWAEDPEYFVGRYEGSDTVGIADLPYAPDSCNELTFVHYAEEATGDQSTDDSESPWWYFWKWFD